MFSAQKSHSGSADSIPASTAPQLTDSSTTDPEVETLISAIAALEKSNASLLLSDKSNKSIINSLQGSVWKKQEELDRQTAKVRELEETVRRLGGIVRRLEETVRRLEAVPSPARSEPYPSSFFYAPRPHSYAASPSAAREKEIERLVKEDQNRFGWR